MHNSFLRSIPTSLIMFIYMYTAVSKLLHLHSQAMVLSHLPYIGRFSRVISIAIPSIELLLVFGLLLPSFTKLALKLSLIVLSAFTLYIIIMLFSNSSLPCTCGGVLEQLTWKQHMVFNFALIALNLIALKTNSSKH